MLEVNGGGVREKDGGRPGKNQSSKRDEGQVDQMTKGKKRRGELWGRVWDVIEYNRRKTMEN